MARVTPLLLIVYLAVATGACKKKPAPEETAAAVVPAPVAPVRPQTWREGLKSSDPNVRADACKSVLPDERGAAPPELVAALGDAHPLVRMAAIKGVLGFILKFADATALPKLLDLAEKDPDIQVRAEAVRTAGALAHRDVVPGLVKIFEKEKNEAIRDEILAMFEREGDRRALPVLLPLLKAQYPPPLAFEALRRIGDRAAVPHVLPLLDHASGAIRSRAIQILGELGDVSVGTRLVKALEEKDPGVVREAIAAVANLGSSEAVPALLKLCDHADPKVRLRAIRALANYRNPEVISAKDAVPKVQAHLAKDKDEVRTEAARALGAMKVRRSLPSLQTAAGATNPLAVRMAALEALGQIGDAKALPALTAALADKDPDVRTVAAKAIGLLGREGKPAGAALREAWKRGETDLDAKLEILRALGRIGDKESIPLVTEVGHKDPVPVLKVAAGGALLQLGDSAGIAVLRPVLTGATDWQERRAAAKAIDVTSPVSSLAALISEALQTEKELLVREELYRQLGAAVGDTAAAHQRKALGESVPFFRLMAADGLCGNADPAGCQALIRALGEAEATVRAEAARRLGLLGVKDAREPLRKLLDDPVVWVANAARRALAKLETGTAQ